MPVAKEHYKYADALISSAITEFATNGNKARKTGMISGAKGAEQLSIAAAIREDKKLRPNVPGDWYNITARKVVRVIQDAAWKEASSAYKKVKRKKTNYLPPTGIEVDSITMVAGLVAFAVKRNEPETTITRRKFIAGAMVTILGVLLTSEARAENRSYISAVRRDVKSYLATKRDSIEKAMAAAL